MIDYELRDRLTVGQAARALNLSAHRIRQLLKAGRLQAIATPYGRLIHPDDLARLVEQRAQPGAGRRDDRHI